MSTSKFPLFERIDGKKRPTKKRDSKVPALDIIEEKSTPRAAQPPAPVARPPSPSPSFQRTNTESRLSSPSPSLHRTDTPSPSPTPPLHRTDTEPRLSSPAPTLSRTLTAPWNPSTPTLTLNEILESDKAKIQLPSAPCSVILDPDPYERRRKRAVLVVEIKSNPRNVKRAIKAAGLDTDSCVASLDVAPKAADLDHVLIQYHGFSLAVKQDSVCVWSALPSINAALADPKEKLKALMQSRLIELFSVIAAAEL